MVRGLGDRMSPCTFPGCPRPSQARGLCHAHAQQRRRRGVLSPLPDPKPCQVCLDAAWLADAGEVRERIAERLGLTPDGLYAHLLRHGQGAVWARTPQLLDLTPTPYR